MIASLVRVGAQKRDRLPAVTTTPFHDSLVHNLCDIRLSSPGVLEQCTLLAEEKVQEWLFVVGTSGFAQDIEIWIVSVHLPLRHRRAIRSASDPLRGEYAPFQPCAIRLGRLGLRKAGAERHDSGEFTRRFQTSRVQASLHFRVFPQ